MEFADDRSSEIYRFAFPGARLLLTTASMVLMALIALLLGADSLAAGRTVSAAAGFTFAAFILIVPVFAWNNEPSRNTGSKARRSVQKSSVSYESKSLPLLVLVVVSGVTMGVIFGVKLGGPFGWVVAAFGVYLATLLIPISVTRTVRRGYVELHAKGIRHRAWAYQADVVWTGVVDATFAKRTYPAIWILVDPSTPINRHYTTPFWKIEKFPIPHVIELDCRRFDVHPMVLMQWIRFYITTPAARVELGTDAAADRLAAIGAS